MYHFFDDRENDLVNRSHEWVAPRYHTEGQLILSQGLLVLEHLAFALEHSPCSFRGDNGKGSPKSQSRSKLLAELLCNTPSYDFDLHIPTRAVVGQAFWIAKINFFKSLSYALEETDGPADIRSACDFEVGQTIYSKMAEELLIALVTSGETHSVAKASAAQLLIKIWNERILLEIDDFAPLLESAWLARNKLQPLLGTLAGTVEWMRLFRDAYDDRFLLFFGNEQITPEQAQAFEEFIFGLSTEQLGVLRAKMLSDEQHVISVEEACRYLAIDPQHWSRESQGPQGLYSSYKERKVRADYRKLSLTEGPQKTAEEYMMEAYLAQPDGPRSTPKR